ncbi:unnamed protein product [Ascophyllum nodosum]
MSELVGMLRQLTTETRTAGDGDGRRGEESGGARRDAAHIYSSGARRGRSLLRRDTESQQFKMKGREKLQRPGISPSTTGLHQNQPTRDQDFQQEWAR